MNIIIKNAEDQQDHFMLAACVTRIQQHLGEGYDAMFHPDCEIHCNTRRNDGWLEYVIKVNYKGGGSIYIGAIQRTPGASVEFHS